MIHTIEGIGNKRDGYHSIQAALAGKNGSQCGYCSPGMVMNLYRCVYDKEIKITTKKSKVLSKFFRNFWRCWKFLSREHICEKIN